MQMPFQLTILGSSSAMPTSLRYPTAQVLNVLGRFFLIDCGEGTQHQIRKNKISFGRIDHIFISHLHGDHFFGLIGYISTQVLLGRTKDLHIYAHSELQRYTQFQQDFLGMGELGFRLVFHPLNFKKPQVILDDVKLTVTSFPLKHRIPCCGFLFQEKEKEPNIRKEQLKFYQIPIREIKNIKDGADFTTEDGEIIPNKKLVIPAPKPRSYAFCSDTAYTEKILPVIQHVDLLYHEATFAESEKEMAKTTFHSTGKEAALIAQKAQAGQLLIGHFSARYKEPTSILKEAQSIFPNTKAVNEGDVYSVIRNQ
ncbi:ribonuclease Z [uncultured Sunxiuqinia sp.]|uniref:ribonuclease Z n=1 Tax=uncultured Sunxiuqinia sp. TaxID=1573825 RepID=UPI002627F7B3|nr:ribonuclease Z [uncultured Sunxiuqinia sp.]